MRVGLFHFRRSAVWRLPLWGCLDLGDGPVGITDLEAGEAAHHNVFSQLADLLCDQLRNGHGLLLDERLLQQADFLIELLDRA